MAEETKEKIRKLVRWNSADSEAVASQLLDRVQEAAKQGLTCGVVTCFIWANEEGERTYEAAFSTLPVELAMWAKDAIERKIIQVNNDR